MRQLDRHTPERPTWLCCRCRATWPCGPARKDLASELDRVALAMTMWTYLEQAVADLNAPSGDLFDRFIRWTH